jgi:hypothetical protein
MPFGDEKNITENSKEKGTGSIQDNLFIITAGGAPSSAVAT